MTDDKPTPRAEVSEGARAAGLFRHGIAGFPGFGGSSGAAD